MIDSIHEFLNVTFLKKKQRKQIKSKRRIKLRTKCRVNYKIEFQKLLWKKIIET